MSQVSISGRRTSATTAVNTRSKEVFRLALRLQKGLHLEVILRRWILIVLVSCRPGDTLVARPILEQEVDWIPIEQAI